MPTERAAAKCPPQERSDETHYGRIYMLSLTYGSRLPPSASRPNSLYFPASFSNCCTARSTERPTQNHLYAEIVKCRIENKNINLKRAYKRFIILLVGRIKAYGFKWLKWYNKQRNIQPKNIKQYLRNTLRGLLLPVICMGSTRLIPSCYKNITNG